MYGMVNRAIVELVTDKYGENVCRRVLTKAGAGNGEYVSMEQYDDGESVSLVVSSAEILDKSPAEMLEEVGEFWIDFALNSDYGDLLYMAGDTLPEVLTNLDALHVRVGESFPKLKPPSFWCTNIESNALILHYVSERSGLSPMVLGLVKGLAKMLDIECMVSQTSFKDQGADHDEFSVRF
ncbi:MAG: heme NO-binding domain-containing protein [Chloroflexota bacterium]